MAQGCSVSTRRRAARLPASASRDHGSPLRRPATDPNGSHPAPPGTYMRLLPDDRDPFFLQEISLFWARVLKSWLQFFSPRFSEIPAEKIFVCGNAFPLFRVIVPGLHPETNPKERKDDDEAQVVGGCGKGSGR